MYSINATMKNADRAKLSNEAVRTSSGLTVKTNLKAGGCGPVGNPHPTPHPPSPV